jgi:hypothetical protein
MLYYLKQYTECPNGILQKTATAKMLNKSLYLILAERAANVLKVFKNRVY